MKNSSVDSTSQTLPSPPLQELCFASLPTDVLHSFCRTVQLGAYTTKAMRAYAEFLRMTGPDLIEALGMTQPTLEVTPLRLCSKELKTVYDFVRPSIRFPLEEMEAVEPYLRKLPNLVTIAVDCEQRRSCASKCLEDLQSIVPLLRRLALR